METTTTSWTSRHHAKRDVDTTRMIHREITSAMTRTLAVLVTSRTHTLCRQEVCKPLLQVLEALDLAVCCHDT